VLQNESLFSRHNFTTHEKNTIEMYVNANNNDLRYQILFVQRVDIKPSKYLHSKFLYHMCFIFFTFSYYP
jgi:hypothetical protein